MTPAWFSNALRLTVVMALLGVSACGTSEPIDPDEIGRADEIPPGPGAATGEDGALIWEF